MSDSGTYAIGIDLGTTYCCVAVYRNGGVEIIPYNGENTVPSYVAFKDGEILIGEVARYQASNNPENTIYDAKRLIGRRYSDRNVQGDKKLWPFTVISDDEDRPLIRVNVDKETTKTYAPEEISSLILKELKLNAEKYLGVPVTEAVITVPAYFTDSQRTATIRAGELAGLNVLRITNEPTAAALAYGLKKRETKDRCVLVFDFGGGTLDVSILNIKGDSYKVRSTTGNMHLGGEDLENRMVEYFVRQINRQFQIDISGDKKMIRRLKTECERTKKDLSYQDHVVIDVPLRTGDADFFHGTITRSRFETQCADKFVQAVDIVKKALEDAKMDKSKIDDIVLSGGSSRIPKVRSMLEIFFNGKSLSYAVNSDEAVATGAAIQAAILNDHAGDSMIDVIIEDVTPMNLGIEVLGGKMSVVIERATRLPTENERIYTTTEDNQVAISVTVYEGDGKLTKENELLGRFDLEGLPEAKTGVPRVSVTFKKDINGVLQVTAYEKINNIKNNIIIRRSNKILYK